MTHRYGILLPLCPIIILLAGCVPVTEPLSDLDKAKPDEWLLGKWQGNSPNSADCEIDIPAVKGNPKGLMRAVCSGRADDPSNSFWFFTTTIGKDTYATFCIEHLYGLFCQQAHPGILKISSPHKRYVATGC